MRALVCSLVIAATWIGAAVAQEPGPPIEMGSSETALSQRTWARFEFLLWRVQNDETPFPLVTTGPGGDPKAGVLGQPTTSVFFGDQLDYRLNGGGRLTLGRWLGDARALGFEMTGFCLETHTLHGEFEANGFDGKPVIARPFFNLQSGQRDAQTITSPQDPLGGRYLGGIDVFGDSRTWGSDANLLLKVAESPTWRWNLLGGFRYLGQKDQLRLDQSSTVLVPGTVGFGGAPAPAPDIVSMRDYFETANHYYGGQIGAQGSLTRGRWFVDLGGTIGLGATDQRQEISGRTLLTDSTGLTLFLPGGLYATPDIIGHHQRWDFAWATEFKARAAFAVTPRCQLGVGYTFLFWDGVLRPGHQLPPAVDPRQVPSNLAYTAAFPSTSPPNLSCSFWAQGIAFSLGFRF